MTSLIAQKIQQIKQQIPANVRLIAVTKQVDVNKIRAAYDAGVRDFGENRLQEALSKQQQLQDLSDITWHFIGHLQANKAKKVLEHFPWIHSLDSLKLAQRLDKIAAELAIKPQVCLQVKILPDPNKYGWEIEELLADLPHLNNLKNLNIQGLTTILPLGLSEAESVNTFKATKQLSEKIQQQGYSHIKMKELSMGMSGDYPLAVQAGATMIRLGRIIFGERKT